MKHEVCSDKSREMVLAKMTTGRIAQLEKAFGNEIKSGNTKFMM